MSTILRGNAAEAAVLNALIRVDLMVLVPFGGGWPYDLLVDTGEALIKVQVKCGRIRDDCVTFNSCGTDHGRGRMSYEERPGGRVCAVPGAPPAHPPRNNHQRGIRFASDYAVESWAASLTRPIG